VIDISWLLTAKDHTAGLDGRPPIMTHSGIYRKVITEFEWFLAQDRSLLK